MRAPPWCQRRLHNTDQPGARADEIDESACARQMVRPYPHGARRRADASLTTIQHRRMFEGTPKAPKRRRGGPKARIHAHRGEFYGHPVGRPRIEQLQARARQLTSPACGGLPCCGYGIVAANLPLQQSRSSFVADFPS